MVDETRYPWPGTALLVHHPASPAIVALILLELIATPILLWMHFRLLSGGAM